MSVYEYLNKNIWKPSNVLNFFVLCCVIIDLILSLINHFVFKSREIGIYLFGFSVPMLCFSLIAFFMAIHNAKVIDEIVKKRSK